MDGRDARRGLAPAYELALELEAAGLTTEELAERLGVPVEAVPTLLALAHAKAGLDDP
jgi:DNA-directed RNA polymerase specialized sigma24 family protein